jgi:hypothetical protein
VNIVTEDVSEAVVVNFRRLTPAQRRQVLRQLITDLDLPQQEDDGTDGRISEAESETALTSGGILEWLEENVPPAEMETFLSERLPDFSRGALTDQQQRLLIEQRLSGLSPLVLYELHNAIVKAGKGRRLAPEEIVERMWGTIRDTDRGLLREIIEDEEYCGY